MASILIKNGLVYDGSGDVPKQESVLIQKDRIAAIGSFGDEQADTVIDATGAIVTPGFIDINTDSDHYLTILTEPHQADFLRSGTTTIIGGNCGASLAPLPTLKALESLQKWGDLSYGKANIHWHTVGEFLKFLSKRGIGVNFGTLVGHATLRRSILGNDFRDLTDGELDSMKYYLESAYSEGAFGFSSGLEYSHSRKTPRYELEELAKITSTHKRVYATHLRHEGEHVLEAIEETIELAKRTNVNIEISHLLPRKNFEDDYRIALKKIEEASAISHIHFDLNASDILPHSLYSFLPKWLQEGGVNAMDAFVRSGQDEEKLLNYFSKFSPNELRVGYVQDRSLKALEGKTIETISKNRGHKPEETLLYVMKLTHLRGILLYENVNKEVRDIYLSHPSAIVASNSASVEVEKTKPCSRPWSFPAFLSYVVEKNYISLESAIQKITSLPAQKYRIRNRGMLKIGNYADISILKNFQPTHVFINGFLALENGILHHGLHGSALIPGL